MSKKKITTNINNEALKTSLGLFLIITSILMTIAFCSFFLNWKADQSEFLEVLDRNTNTRNILGNIGAFISELFIHKGIGIAAFLIPVSIFIFGVKILVDKNLVKTWKFVSHSIFILIWLPIIFGYFLNKEYVFSGIYGFEVADYLRKIMGNLGIVSLLVFSLIIYIIFEFNLTSANVKNRFNNTFSKFKNIKSEVESSINDYSENIKKELNEQDDNNKTENQQQEIIIEEYIPESEENKVNKYKKTGKLNLKNKANSSLVFEVNTITNEDNAEEENQDLLLKFKEDNSLDNFDIIPVNDNQQEKFELVTLKNEDQDNQQEKFELVTFNNQENIPNESLENDQVENDQVENDQENHINQLSMKVITTTEAISDYNKNQEPKELLPYDPRKDLSSYISPPTDLIKSNNASETITINSEELEFNKNRIVETLGNYGIGITHIKATVGPTVTLYEIIPEAGVRISKIKNLEDDIALSLAALGIRIIAPIPGKGTIGIEVPNGKPSIVSMYSVLSSPKFDRKDMELPIAFGKTISNETFVEDLAKMPHLLLAGATGQGKSVGLNAIITSLLYKKHPAELKFVLIDPKKVELTLYNKIEKHFLAKIPDTDDAIITDNHKVINTLNSLCIEMDNRYELLKTAMVRNIKEYNEKFVNRTLNPNKGHRFLPYIVLIVDEFADLIMTAGKEVELPIARLAQLARAIGIHLIIATQRPSVNVITGTIKANFPARIAFRVTSKIDSRTILDGPGADQLIGRGDMLFTKGNDLVRLQCAFIDTPDVDKITEYIGSQRSYPEPYLLPEYNPDENKDLSSFDILERDDMFEEAARVLVNAQQGSTSLIQRKLSLGYNRAGRIMDQLEAASIVGPFEGSKARKVMFSDLISLEQYLDSLKNKNY